MTTDLEAPGTLTGREHPETSRAAAAKALGRSGTKRHAVLRALVRFKGLTDEQCAQFLGYGPNTQRPRRVELVRLGFVEASDRRRLTADGNSSIVWQATAAGVAALEAVEEA